jgi:HAD superfamily hydrolase (TIGR01509 family)
LSSTKALPAVVFDCDGVLVDSEAAWKKALREALAANGVPWGRHRAGAMIGGSVPEAVAFMENELGRSLDADQIGREIYGSVLATVSEGLSPMPGAIALVTSLQGTRPLAVASNGSRETVMACLRAAGIPDVFDAVVALGPMTRPKPAPDLYLESCARLEVEPSQAVALEDSFRGATAAQRAGLRVVGVGASDGLADVCDLVVASLEDFRLKDFLTKSIARDGDDEGAR